MIQMSEYMKLFHCIISKLINYMKLYHYFYILNLLLVHHKRDVRNPRQLVIALEKISINYPIKF